jgi:hypothetical protein
MLALMRLCSHLRKIVADTMGLLLTQDTFSGADNKADEAGNKAKGERRLSHRQWGVRMQYPWLVVHAQATALLSLLADGLLPPLRRRR